MLKALEEFWKIFAARYKGRNVIFAYDLLNEPHIRWKTPAMQERWNRFVLAKYGTIGKAAQAWGVPAESMKADAIPIPADKDKLLDPALLDYQLFREEVADEWTRRQAAAIKSADPEALVTVGLIQWSVPAVTWAPGAYAAFRPARQAKYLDFMEVHFYPLERGCYEYGDAQAGKRNLAYLEAVVREVAACGRPVVIAEFGWYGGGTIPVGARQSKPGSEDNQAAWCSRLIETTKPMACGWLNWGFHDHPQAKDVSVLTGLVTVEGKTKAWGRRFAELAKELRDHVPGGSVGQRPALPWEKCITSAKAADEFRAEYVRTRR